MNIDEILEELYLFDPELRAEEADLKDIIGKLIEKKPDAEADDAFKTRLKAELVREVEQRRKRKGFFVVHRTQIVRVAGIAAALIVVLVFAVRPGLLRFGSEETDTQILRQEAPGSGLTVESEVRSAAPAPDPAAESAAEPMVMMKKMTSVAADEDISGFTGAEAPAFENEEYREYAENGFIKASIEPLSTFSIDVDTASYSNLRRYINSGRLPPAGAVRIEELVNYFTYDYPQPGPEQPFSFTSELGACPWNPESMLLHIGLQGYEVAAEELPPSNIVFLLDSSGSMSDENKLPLLKDSIALLLERLRPEDRVSIVAYAGSAGLVLPPTPGNRRAEILAAVDRLEAGGSTAGGAGIELAYRTAAAGLIEDGSNRVIIATDGDFNVGQSSEEELVAMIEQRRDQGIFLTVLGLGMGNYKDARMEALADNGNGNYAYIDTLSEANKVLITEFSSTMLTIAKDVKIQIDFNPGVVDSYRLVGYENRLLNAEDFDDDRKDAGEIGAGHSVTALYEIIPAHAPTAAELAEIRFRYKKPDEDQSRLIIESISSEPSGDLSADFKLSAAAAEWGLYLQSSDFTAPGGLQRALRLAEEAAGESDPFGYRAGFIELLKKTERLTAE